MSLTSGRPVVVAGLRHKPTRQRPELNRVDRETCPTICLLDHLETDDAIDCAITRGVGFSDCFFCCRRGGALIICHDRHTLPQSVIGIVVSRVRHRRRCRRCRLDVEQKRSTERRGEARNKPQLQQHTPDPVSRSTRRSTQRLVALARNPAGSNRPHHQAATRNQRPNIAAHSPSLRLIRRPPSTLNPSHPIAHDPPSPPDTPVRLFLSSSRPAGAVSTR